MIPRLRSTSPWLAAILALILPIAPLRADDAPQPAHGRLDVRRPQVRAGLHPFRLRQAGCAQGRHADAAGDRHLRQPQPVHPQGQQRRRPGHGVRHADRRQPGRAVLGVRPDRGEHRDPEGPLVCDLHAPARGALAGRHAGHGRRRDLDPRHPQDQGPPLLPRLLRQHRQGREGRRAPGQDDLRRQDEPGAAPDRRPDAGPAQALLREGRVRQDHPDAAARQRPLSDQTGRPRAHDRLRARSELLGSEAAGQPRAQQFRRGPLRILSGRECRAGVVQGRQLRPPDREQFQGLGDRLYRPAVREEADRARGNPEPARHRHAGFRVQHPPRDLQGPEGAGGARLRVRFRMDQPEPVLRPVPADRELLLEQRAGVVRPAERGRAEAAGALPRPAAAGGLHQGVQSPLDRGHRPAPEPSHRARDAARGGLAGAGRAAREQGHRPAARVRDPAGPARLRADRRAVRPEPQAPRRPGDFAYGRHRPVPEPPRRFRLRHGGRQLGREPVAGQRAARLLGQPGGRHPRQPQPRRHQEPGGRRPGRQDRPGAHRARTW